MKPNRNGFALDEEGERRQWIDKYRSSGLGLKQFAHRHGLRPGQLHYWVYQSAKPSGSPDALPSFQEVRLPAPAIASGSWSLEVGLSNGTTVRLAPETDLSRAIALIDALRRPCSSR